MEFDQFLDQGQPNAQPPLLAVRALVGLCEQIEGAQQRVLVHADAVVADIDDGPVALRPGVDGHPAAGRCVLGGIVEQIDQNLHDALGIAMNRQRLLGQVDLQFMAHTLQQGGGLLDGVAHQGAQVQAVLIQPNAAALDPGRVEQVVDQAAHVTHLPANDGAAVAHGLRGGVGSAHHFGSHRNRRQRVAQFMGQHGQEFVLAFVADAQGALGHQPIGDVNRHHHRAIDSGLATPDGRGRGQEDAPFTTVARRDNFDQIAGDLTAQGPAQRPLRGAQALAMARAAIGPLTTPGGRASLWQVAPDLPSL